jgi:hypothetical protein
MSNNPVDILSFIYESKMSIPDTLCEEIIEKFDNQIDGKYDGLTIGGVNKNIKDTIDFIIPYKSDVWSKINSFLHKELNKNLQKYITKINLDSYYPNMNNNEDGSIFTNSKLHVDCFMIQKYNKECGKYTYHNDFSVDGNRHRIITYLWYLNTVTEGGETEFWDGYKIKPEQGKLILFPANWCFQHRGNMPISHDKYIITGWFYINNF